MLGIYFILALILALIAIFSKNRLTSRISVIVFEVVQVLFCIYVTQNLDKTELTYFTFDRLGILFLVLVSILSIPTVYHSFIYLKHTNSQRIYQYNAAFIGLVAALTGAYLSTSLTVTWIFVETTTLLLAVLIYHERTVYALEATWKYILVCSVGIALAYMGILFLSATAEATGKELVSFENLAQIVKHANPLYLKITFLFVLIGYSTKMELFPMHTVGIDVNSVAPPPIGGFISSAVVNVGFLSIFRVFIILSNNPELKIWMSHVFIIAGILSLLVSAGYMLKAKHNKRMLAYSTLENMGIVAIAIGIGGIGYYAALLHIIFHSFTKASLFFQIGQAYRVMKTYKIAESGEYFKLFPAGAMVLITGTILISAIPPSGMFISEFLVIKALINSNSWFILIAMLVLLCFIVYALFNRVFHILYSKPKENSHADHGEKVSWVETFSQWILLGVVIAFCFYQPAFLTDFLMEALKVLN